jgi:hypothetical protein
LLTHQNWRVKTAKRLALFAAIISTVCYVAGAVFFYSMQREFTFPRQHEQVAESPLARVPDAEAYRVATGAGAVEAWFLPAFRRADRCPVVIFSHGNGELIDEVIPYEEGQKLAMTAAKGTLRLYECGHRCWLPDKIPIARDIHEFLRANGMLPAGAD